jgi:hypothetical protein
MAAAEGSHAFAPSTASRSRAADSPAVRTDPLDDWALDDFDFEFDEDFEDEDEAL